MTIDTKRCPRCNQILPLSKFTKQKDKKDGLRSHCTECRNASARKQYRRNYDQKPGFRYRMRSWVFKTKYGISIEDYEILFKQQNGKCKICGDSPTAEIGHGRLHVDHDHDTNRIRGLLCSACNHGIGSFKDDPRLLVNAIEYLAI